MTMVLRAVVLVVVAILVTASVGFVQGSSHAGPAVSCATETQCLPLGLHCLDGSCVECTSKSHCPFADKPSCINNQCRACTIDHECRNGACRKATGVCEECRYDSWCERFGRTNICMDMMCRDANVQLTGLTGSTRDTGGATGSGWNLGGSGKTTVASPGTGGAAAMPSGGLSGWPGVNNYTGTTVSSGSQPAGPASFRVNMGQPVSGITAADFYTRTVAGAPSVDRLVVTPVAPPTSTPVGGNKSPQYSSYDVDVYFTQDSPPGVVDVFMNVTERSLYPPPPDSALGQYHVKRVSHGSDESSSRVVWVLISAIGCILLLVLAVTCCREQRKRVAEANQSKHKPRGKAGDHTVAVTQY